MLKVFTGSREKIVDAAQRFLTDTGSDVSVTTLDDTAHVEEILHLAENKSLFGGAVSVRLDGVLKNEELKEYILGHLADFSASANTFALLEEKIDAETLSIFKEEKIEVSRSEHIKKGKPEFSIFSLSDALSSRDKRALWVKYTEAKEAGETPEAIAGILFWQLKTVLTVMAGAEKTLNPFVASKAKGALRKYSEGELKTLAFRLLSLYHDAHRGQGDLSEGLERLILSV